MASENSTGMTSTTLLDRLRSEAVGFLRQGKNAEAAVRIREALEGAPEQADLHNLLGSALAGQGQLDQAQACFSRAMELKPDFAEAMVNLGHNLRRVGKTAEALMYYHRALKFRPDWAEIHNNIGLGFRSLGKSVEAEDHFRKALSLQPTHTDARNNLGVILADLGRRAEAAAVYQQVLRQQPKSAGTHNNLGVVLLLQGKVREAIECFQKALQFKTAYPDACNNLGNALLQEGRLEEAEQSLRRSLELKPDLSEACNNLARVLVRQGKIDEAIVYFQQAVRLQPNYADCHRNLATCWLLQGDYVQGWPEFEWRLRTSDAPSRHFEQPRWQGENLQGQTLLLHAEQKPEDTLQFIRYARLLREQGAIVDVECQPALTSLLSRCPDVSQVIPRGSPLPEHDLHVLLLSLPAMLETGLDTIPANIPYLHANPEQVERWQKELSGIGKFKVGIAWQRAPQNAEERQRTLPPGLFGRLAKIDGVRLVSMQKPFARDQWNHLIENWNLVDVGQRMDEPESLADAAAIFKNLDLLITGDTEFAHLAGGLGVPVWVILPKVPDWRWLMDREDSPWYPTMRLFRQKEWGKWDEVFEQVAVELQKQPPLEKPDFYHRLGRSLLGSQKVPEAVSAFRRGLELAPDNSAMRSDLGVALTKQGQKEEALASFEKAVEIKPDNVEALFHLGNLLRDMQRQTEAEDRYRQGLQHQPNMPGLLNHLGLVLLWRAAHDEAEQCFRRAAQVSPDAPAPYLNNLGILLEQQNRLDDAVSVFQKVLSCKEREEAPDAHKNLAMIQLVRGDYARGWSEYEWRLQCHGRERKFEQPRWDGQPLEGKPILLWTEQGLGDTLQFIRYAPLVKQRGGYVMVECRNVLKPLLSRCPGIDLLLIQGMPLPEFSCQVALLSLPHIFQTNDKTIPAEVPYLSAEPARIESWREQLRDLGSLKVGIIWQGSPSYGSDRNRSIPLKHYEPLTRVPGIRLISLQKGYGLEQLKPLAELWQIVDLSERIDLDGAFLDTAAVMKNLDLIISSDTSACHMAGALGVPIWVALGQGCDWRWLREREDTPWYPTMRLFRQRRWGDWGEIFERMAEELRSLPGMNLSAGPLRAEISPGELLDKITILQIKREWLLDERQLSNVRVELGALLVEQARHLKPRRDINELIAALKKVNQDLWEVEDDLRRHEAQQDFGPRFIELARSVYRLNDERSRLKRKINDRLGSQIIEEKSYGRINGQAETNHRPQE